MLARFERARILEALGQTADARAAWQDAQRFWQHADRPRPELKEGAAALARLTDAPAH